MTSGETQTQIFANWLTSHAKRMTKDNRKNSEYHVVAAIRKLRIDKNCPAKKTHSQTVLKMSSTSDLKTPTAPKTLVSLNTVMQRTAKKCCWFT